MATEKFYATRPFRYGTRRLQAGEEVELTGPHQRLYTALGHVTDKKPRAAKAAAAEFIPDGNLAKAKPKAKPGARARAKKAK